MDGISLDFYRQKRRFLIKRMNLRPKARVLQSFEDRVRIDRRPPRNLRNRHPRRRRLRANLAPFTPCTLDRAGQPGGRGEDPDITF